MLSIGDTIKKEREKLNISRNKFAQKTSLSAVQLYRIETGIATPHLSTLKIIADELDLKVKDLMINFPNAETNDIATQVKKARISLGLNQTEFANLCNISFSSLQNIEQRRNLEKRTRVIKKILLVINSL